MPYYLPPSTIFLSVPDPSTWQSTLPGLNAAGLVLRSAQVTTLTHIIGPNRFVSAGWDNSALGRPAAS
jgi:hypothetical protein